MRRTSAAQLAADAGVTRQTIYAIEDGSFVPNTAISLRLARALNVTVEEIFSITDERPNAPVRTHLFNSAEPSNKGQLVRLCQVNERLVAVPVSFLPTYLPPIDGIIESKSGSTAWIEPPTDLPKNGKRLLLAGCDPALSLLNGELSASEMEIIDIASSSRCALKWLKQGRVHVAGSHLFDRVTGDYNLPFIKRLFPKGSIRVVTFAVWEQGLVLPLGNPKRVRSLADLSRKKITFINREKGSGSRDVLDSGLREAGIDAKQIRGYQSIAHGHLPAAYAVATGTADCCIATRSAARCFGLDFVPLAVERFDLSFTKRSLELPAAKALLDLLNRASFRKKLQAIAGYDTAHTGQVLV